MTTFSELTTTRVGGAARLMVETTDADSLVAAVRDAWESGEPWLVFGGGSNLLVADDGFDGTAVHVGNRGIQQIGSDDASVTLRVQAGEPWDALVAFSVENGLAGIEALSGIPGASGAAPIQNIGAYGQEVADTLEAIDYLDYLSGELTRIPASELELGYRMSAMKKGRQGVVVAIELRLGRGGLSEPIGYAQLASALSVSLGERRPVAEVREAVLRLRASKGMVLSDADPDSVSTGSFFTNPIVGERFAASLPATAPRWSLEPELPDRVVPLEQSALLDEARPLATAADRQVKLSAAWLIENSGIRRGFSLPGARAAISSKHTLALVNTGGATAAQVAELARFVQSRVLNEFGVLLQPEPVLVGLEL
ncbi:UDP-N-acetylmuramate dehydrogenase [Homoserinimonas aerilata]|uniref:UDP-N-acetylenolpyruvoylglucosamine reductase n=1 Tax=Homoserinimonas aerilata TaxID=1162970 RepID=A0A542YAD2_9MICO|nr:UDP-N-acetylmuramate dehydrogenase [Homoserinimonas aerilata]TQL45061.1 UDP-N-acetylmuramate dehydrogenase [Homoserinimonas aerilata]